MITGLTWAALEGEGSTRAALLELLALVERGLLGAEPCEIHADPAAGFSLYTPEDGGMGVHLGFHDLEEKLRRLAQLRQHLDRRGQSAYAVNLTYPGKIITRLLPSEGKGSHP